MGLFLFFYTDEIDKHTPINQFAISLKLNRVNFGVIYNLFIII